MAHVGSGRYKVDGCNLASTKVLKVLCSPGPERQGSARFHPSTVGSWAWALYLRGWDISYLNPKSM